MNRLRSFPFPPYVMILRSAFVLLGLILLAGPAAADDLLVCASGCTYSTIQAAIDASTNPGDVVKVAQGTYYENISITSDKNLSVVGGWNSTFTQRSADPNLTVVSADACHENCGDLTAFSITADSGIAVTLGLQSLKLIDGLGRHGGGVVASAINGGTISLSLDGIIANPQCQTQALQFRANSGGVFNFSLVNCIFCNLHVDTCALLDVGGNDNGTMNGTISNCTISNNESRTLAALYAEANGGSSTQLAIVNTILWGNRDYAGNAADLFLSQDDGAGSSLVVNATYSDIGTVILDPRSPYATYNGDGSDLNTDPLLIDPEGGNFHLNSDSPCINAGTDAGAPVTDFEGDWHDPLLGVDIGADEYVDKPFQGLQLLSLKGRERIGAGLPYQITWGAPKAWKNFVLSISPDNGATWRQIKRVTTSGQRHFGWTAPKPGKNAATYRLKIDAYNPTGTTLLGSAQSAAPFTVETVRLETCNGGYIYHAGDAARIYWTVNRLPHPLATQALYYTINGGVSWRHILPDSAPDTPNLAWTIPSIAGTHTKCKFKVVLKDAQNHLLGVDTSDRFFTIVGP